MNSLATLTLLYFLLTLASAGILFFSFKSSIDNSGRYFLLGEILTLLMLVQVFFTNLNPNHVNVTILFIGNWFATSSEIAIFFSILSLTKKIRFREYLFAIFIAGMYCAFIEFSRFQIDPMLPVPLFAGFNLVLAIATFLACRTPSNRDLQDNSFLNWIGYLEIGLACFALLRIGSYFTGAIIAPRSPTLINTLMYSIFLVLSVFRYISYQSLRTTWVDPRSANANYLNKNLTKILNEKNQLLQHLIISNRALGISALASTLTHQLSQPITGIALYTESLKRDLVHSGQNKKTIDTLNTIIEQSEKLSDLINNLRRLFIARAQEFSVINLTQTINEVLEIIEPALRSKKIVLTKSYITNPKIIANSIQLQQVIINLFHNAIEAIVEGDDLNKEITLIITQENNDAVMYMKDTGKGIKPDMLEGMFELYSSSKDNGMGVGLWLSKTIIDKHHGNITARNHPNGGAEFKIQIPVFKNNSNIDEHEI